MCLRREDEERRVVYRTAALMELLVKPMLYYWPPVGWIRLLHGYHFRDRPVKFQGANNFRVVRSVCAVVDEPIYGYRHNNLGIRQPLKYGAKVGHMDIAVSVLIQDENHSVRPAAFFDSSQNCWQVQRKAAF